MRGVAHGEGATPEAQSADAGSCAQSAKRPSDRVPLTFWGPTHVRNPDREPARTFRRSSRRAFLRAGASGALGLGLGGLTAQRAHGQLSASPTRSVIVLWLWGGPSHLDTFDMKPEAPIEYRGPFEPVSTAVPGLHICELLPG